MKPNLCISSYRNSSVRYVVNPGDKRTRTISIQSDYNEGRDRIVTTDMTMLPEDDEVDLRPSGVERSQSTVSKGMNSIYAEK